MYDRSRFYGRDGRDCPSGDWMDRIRGDADDCCKRGPTGATGPTGPAGPRGFRGERGPMGPRGATGATVPPDLPAVRLARPDPPDLAEQLVLRDQLARVARLDPPAQVV